MKLCDLTEHEQMVLVALTSHVVASDGKLSDDEAGAMDYLHEEMGEDEWHVANDRARARRTSLSNALELAAEVERPEARSLLFQMLKMVAESDGVVSEEQGLLDGLAKVWSL